MFAQGTDNRVKICCNNCQRPTKAAQMTTRVGPPAVSDDSASPGESPGFGALTYGDGRHALHIFPKAVGHKKEEAVGSCEVGGWHVHKGAVGVKGQGAMGTTPPWQRAQHVPVGVGGVGQHAGRRDRKRLVPRGGVGHRGHDGRVVLI
jgi:hypothetical protein